MPLTKKQLLIPRVKCVLRYPDSRFPVGSILSQDFEDHELYVYIDSNRKFWLICNPELYPEIFTPLPWWSDRKPEDMPKYLKDQAGVYSKATWGVSMKLFTSDGELWHITENVMSFFEPATEEEYTAYINQNQ